MRGASCPAGSVSPHAPSVTRCWRIGKEPVRGSGPVPEPCVSTVARPGLAPGSRSGSGGQEPEPPQQRDPSRHGARSKQFRVYLTPDYSGRSREKVGASADLQ